MSKLLEKTIQLKALQALKQHYSELNPQTYIFCDKELTTKKEFGRNRADGLLCFEKDNKPFTVSLEAKSHKTLNALISNFNDNKIGLQCLLIAAVISIIICFSVFQAIKLHWFLILLIGLISFAGSFYVAARTSIKLDLRNHRVVDVINQIKKYPANEKWIAYSKYADNLLLKTSSSDKLDYLKDLEKKCEENGIGLLLISNKSIKKKIFPKTKKGNFLHYYQRETEIKVHIVKEVISQF